MKMTVLALPAIAFAFSGSALLTGASEPNVALSVPTERKPKKATPDIFGSPTLISMAELGLTGPSGVAFHPRTGHLFVISDKGSIAELDGQGRRLRMTPIKGDIEDVTVHLPSSNLLLLVERKPRLVLFDPVVFAEVRRWHLDPSILVGAEAPKNRGFEGAIFRADGGRPGGGVLYLTHQSLPAQVVSLAFDPLSSGQHVGAEAVLDRWALKGHNNLTGLTYLPGLNRLLLIDGRRKRMVVLTLEGSVVAEVAAPGVQPEGLAFDAAGTLWVADDQQGLLRCQGALAALTKHLGATPP
jgi:uncharacterized protein YjiK